MLQYKKIFSLAALLLFILPIATAFCCCVDDDLLSSNRKQPEHNHSEHHHDHSHEQNKSDKSVPDSCECGHEILGALNNQNIDISNFSFSISSFLSQSFLTTKPSILKLHSSIFDFHDTGPPGSRFSTTPLYLQISNLRI